MISARDREFEALRCSRLRKRVDGRHIELDVDVAFEEPGIVSLIGPNGAGKTTLLNLISGWLLPDSGKCQVGKQNITGWAPYRIVKFGLARTFQEIRLISLLSALDNLVLARRGQYGETFGGAVFRRGVKAQEAYNREYCLNLLEVLGLAERKNELPSKLSYGQQKLLTFGCCIATDPRILLLDEPLSGVEPRMANVLLNTMTKLARDGHLIVLVEHNLDAVQEVSDRVLLMSQGRIVADGSPHDVLHKAEVLDAYVR